MEWVLIRRAQGTIKSVDFPGERALVSRQGGMADTPGPTRSSKQKKRQVSTDGNDDRCVQTTGRAAGRSGQGGGGRGGERGWWCKKE